MPLTPENEKIPILVIVGATASGKTALGVGMAKRLDGEVVSADSMQIYEGMDIATAKPDVEEMDGVAHHLIGFLPVTENFSVAKYVFLAKERIFDIYKRGKLPIVVGGTGLYIDSLVENIDFPEIEGDGAYREELKARAATEGAQQLLDELNLIDPETASKLHPNNLSRIIRALEVYKCGGHKMSELVKESRKNPAPFSPVYIGINYDNREVLYDRINRRVDAMLEAGLVEEACKYRNINACTSAQAIGYKELEPYFSGETSLEEAIENLKMQTRRYAKRQLTWFRKNEKINWIYADNLSFDELLQKACEVYMRERNDNN